MIRYVFHLPLSFSINSFLWLKLHFQPVPTQQDLQSRIPGGRIAISAKPYVLPKPAFGPGSMEYVRRKADADEVGNGNGSDMVPSGNYAGAGAYF